MAERSASVVGDVRVGAYDQVLARAGGGLIGDAIDGEGDARPASSVSTIVIEFVEAAAICPGVGIGPWGLEACVGWVA